MKPVTIEDIISNNSPIPKREGKRTRTRTRNQEHDKTRVRKKNRRIERPKRKKKTREKGNKKYVTIQDIRSSNSPIPE